MLCKKFYLHVMNKKSINKIKLIAKNTHNLQAIRTDKLKKLYKIGKNPFINNWNQSHTSTKILSLFKKNNLLNQDVSVAGRIMTFRCIGKISFIKIQDRDGQIQLYIKINEIGEDSYKEFKKLDLGDIIGVSGSVFKTKTGEITILVKKYSLLSKSLRPLPEKWHGLTDSEQIYRQRYLDLIINKNSRNRFYIRSELIKEMRNFLWKLDYTEVETPSLQNVATGAAARSFTTYMNALSHNFVLRIALELYLKRMLVGGFDRVFEIGRIFRNEGFSKKHNPEFTMLELYEAYTDFRGMMKIIYNMIQYLCKKVLGTTCVQQSNGETIELGGQWKEISYKDSIIQATKDSKWFSRSKKEKYEKCLNMGINIDSNIQDYEITNNIFEKKVEPTLIQPTFVIYFPKEICPLAKINEKDKSIIDVFELFINGQEIAPAYSEQNDPLLQRKMFLKQAGENIHNVDEDFLIAIEHGMPPAGGMGVGIDRLCALLTGAKNIRDTILFPTLKPLQNN